jgi:hypothetical protein
MTPGVQRLGDDPPDRQTRVERRLGSWNTICTLLRPSLPVRLAQFKSPLLGAIKPINNCANVLSTA